MDTAAVEASLVVKRCHGHLGGSHESVDVVLGLDQVLRDREHLRLVVEHRVLVLLEGDGPADALLDALTARVNHVVLGAEGVDLKNKR